MGSLFIFMKKYYALCIVDCVLFCALLTACSGPKMIPDQTLEAIIADVLLTEGVISSGLKDGDVTTRLDSIDFYSPILNRYGYTIVDFRFTINKLATRKSNPLEGVMEHVVATIDKQAIVAQHRYDVSRRYDSLALNAYADTIYRKDTTIKGSLKKIRIALDTIRAGDYRLQMSYRSTSDYRLPQKSIRYYFTRTGKKPSVENSLWLSRSDKLREFNEVISTVKDYDSLIIYFAEAQVNLSSDRGRNKSKVKAPKLKDTSFVENISIIYTPLLHDARSRYHNEIYGREVVFFSEILYNDENKFKKDSLPGPLGRQQ